MDFTTEVITTYSVMFTPNLFEIELVQQKKFSFLHHSITTDMIITTTVSLQPLSVGRVNQIMSISSNFEPSIHNHISNKLSGGPQQSWTERRTALFAHSCCVPSASWCGCSSPVSTQDHSAELPLYLIIAASLAS